MTNLKMKTLAAGFAGAVALSAFGGTAFASQPENPGCFGRDRAAYIQDVALASDAGPGASEVGVILAGRAGDNGSINRAYMAGCGGTP